MEDQVLHSQTCQCYCMWTHSLVLW